MMNPYSILISHLASLNGRDHKYNDIILVIFITSNHLQEICSNPKLFVGGASHMDVKQGMLNDSWLLAAMAALSQDQILLNQVIPPNQSLNKG